MQPRRYGKAGLGEADRRFEQLRPGEPAVLPVDGFKHAQYARRADRTAADHGVVEGHRLVAGHEKALVRRSGRRLAAVEGLHPPAIEMQHEGAAADAGTLWFDQVEHHLHGDRRIDRRATGAQDLATGVGSQWIGRRRHVPSGRRAVQP